MNGNRNLKWVWLVGCVAITLLFCTQTYWLICQYKYSLDRQEKIFEEDCSRLLKNDFAARKVLSDKKQKKGKEHRLTMKIVSEFDFKHSKHSKTVISFWDTGRFLGRVEGTDITGDDAYEMSSRYLAWCAQKPNWAYYQYLFRKHGYDEIIDFRFVKYRNVFLDARYETDGIWAKTVKVSYQTNPIFHQGIAFSVEITAASVLKTMFYQLLGSVLFFVILACCLFYLIRTIVVQKRIDRIRHEFLKNMIYEMKQPRVDETSEESVVFIGSIAFCYAQNELRKDNERVIVTSRQAEILKLLAARQNQLVERETILNEVWGDDSYSNSLALNVQITYLRRALSSDSSVSIEAVIKKGYILKTKKTNIACSL